MRVALIILGMGCATPNTAASLPVSQAPDGFWDHWGDGRAEIATYALIQPRYGEPRRGEAVLVTVTETFTDATRVKSDGGHADEFPVVKLNAIRDFDTGVYDYNVMSSAFVPLDGRMAWGVPAKTSFSAQEWCGHVYEQVLPRDDGAHWTSHSYFDGEADRDAVWPLPPDAVFEDALTLLVRGLAGHPGDRVRVKVLTRAMDARFRHLPATFEDATLAWGAAEDVEVPAGRFAARSVTLDRDDGVDATWWVEVAPPHRIIRWRRTDGERADLVAVERMAYWSHNGNEDEPLRRRLALPPRTWVGQGTTPTP